MLAPGIIDYGTRKYNYKKRRQLEGARGRTWPPIILPRSTTKVIQVVHNPSMPHSGLALVIFQHFKEVPLELSDHAAAGRHIRKRSSWTWHPCIFLHRTEVVLFKIFYKKKFPPFSSSLNEFAFMQIKQLQRVLRQYCSSTHNSSPARDKPTS